MKPALVSVTSFLHCCTLELCALICVLRRLISCLRGGPRIGEVGRVNREAAEVPGENSAKARNCGELIKITNSEFI